MKTPTPIDAIAGRKQRTAEQIAASNAAYLSTLSTAVTAVESYDTTKIQDRKERRGIPYVGTGGIDTRRDPLLEVIDREHQAEHDARIRSRRKATAA